MKSGILMLSSGTVLSVGTVGVTGRCTGVGVTGLLTTGGVFVTPDWLAGAAALFMLPRISTLDCLGCVPYTYQ